MKKYMLYALTGIFSLTFIPVEVKAVNNGSPTEIQSDSMITRLLLTQRLEEIHKINTDDLSISEKRELREEERSINNTLSDGYGGLYISVGALIIILILVLIILL